MELFGDISIDYMHKYTADIININELLIRPCRHGMFLYPAQIEWGRIQRIR